MAVMECADDEENATIFEPEEKDNDVMLSPAPIQPRHKAQVGWPRRKEDPRQSGDDHRDERKIGEMYSHDRSP